MTKNVKKLALSRETLLDLAVDRDTLRAAVGGVTVGCTAYCAPSRTCR